jgi:PAS domain S-box-containing protein
MRSKVEALRSEVAWLRSELGKAGRLLGELCKTIPGAVFVCDGTGVIETASEAATAMLGYAEHELSKRPLAGHVHDRDTDRRADDARGGGMSGPG